MEFRNQIGREEFDDQTLMSVLLRLGTIVRVKKGLYIFGESYRRAPYCRELLANLMYGSSFMSLEYALGYYGLVKKCET